MSDGLLNSRNLCAERVKVSLRLVKVVRAIGMLDTQLLYRSIDALML